MGRRYGTSQVDAIDPSSLRRIPFESHDSVSQRRGLALPHAPVLVPVLASDGELVTASVSLATFRNHRHAMYPGETPLEVLVERCVVRAHDDEHLGIRK